MKIFPFHCIVLLLLFSFSTALVRAATEEKRSPNIVLIMTDDQGWAQTGYYDHPVLKTPNLDAMAANGLRFDRFYAAGPVCSPTRASVLTGRTHDRGGVPTHGFPLRHQEKTLSEALRAHGYATGHFGKWHLDGIRGPGIPISADDEYGPAHFGFEEWVSVTNFFDLDPWMSDNGEFKKFHGSSSDIIADQAVQFISASVEKGQPFFAVIWDGSPHGPARALPEDKAAFEELDEKSANHYGELVAVDRSIGTVREALRELGVADNTLIWFCSDNGGLSGIEPSSVGILRGHKGQTYEGGIRVPGILEWPAGVTPRVTDYPASTMDIFPTLAAILQLPEDVMLEPVDGADLTPLFQEEADEREKPIGFRFGSKKAWIDNDWKIVQGDGGAEEFAIYNLADDPGETTDLREQHPEIYERMVGQYQEWSDSVDASVAGKDYPEGEVKKTPAPIRWTEHPKFKHLLKELN